MHSQELDRAAAAKKNAADAVEATKPKPRVRPRLTSPPSPDLSTRRFTPSLKTTSRFLLSPPHYLHRIPLTLVSPPPAALTVFSSAWRTAFAPQAPLKPHGCLPTSRCPASSLPPPNPAGYSLHVFVCAGDQELQSGGCRCRGREAACREGG